MTREWIQTEVKGAQGRSQHVYAFRLRVTKEPIQLGRRASVSTEESPGRGGGIIVKGELERTRTLMTLPVCLGSQEKGVEVLKAVSGDNSFELFCSEEERPINVNFRRPVKMG